MATPTPPTDPDSLAVLHALSRDSLSPEDAYNALEGVRNIAGRNVISMTDAKNTKIACGGPAVVRDCTEPVVPRAVPVAQEASDPI